MANGSRLFLLFILGPCLALFLFIVLLDIVSLRDVRKVKNDFLAVYTASAKAGEEVIIYRAESEDWQGQAGHVKEKFEELIRIAAMTECILIRQSRMSSRTFLQKRRETWAMGMARSGSAYVTRSWRIPVSAGDVQNILSGNHFSGSSF
ncbi:MAG: hypothetical protein UX72_C0030G0032 [Parcubacteria group bacterium GW2011_GWA2_47_10]|nr:MAG: hypothetical protein UX72_C0030G0032 [Parcubacteria group bacterium GW2011_GWA2_47_10]